MKNASTRDLYNYWDTLRGGRAAPERNTIDPAAIRHVLTDTFMLEVDDGHLFPLRIVGSGMNALFGRELKGEAFLGLWRNQDHLCVESLVAAVLDDVAPAVAGVSAAPAGRDPIDLELVLLPLRHHGKTHARILGCLSAVSIPQWYGLVPVDTLELRSLRILRNEGQPFATPLRPVAPTHTLVSYTDFADDMPPVARTPMRRAHLVVHEGGR